MAMIYITNSQEHKPDFKIILIPTASLQVSLVWSKTRSCWQLYCLCWYHPLFPIYFNETKKSPEYLKKANCCAHLSIIRNFRFLLSYCSVRFILTEQSCRKKLTVNWSEDWHAGQKHLMAC